MQVDEEPSSPRAKRWLTPLAVAWLILALPCWWLSAMVFVNWAGGEHPRSICGDYPCEVVGALAMVYVVVPVSAIGALVVVARAVWRTLRDAPPS